MSNIKELIRAEIERRKGYISVTHFAEDLLSFLDTLPDEPVSDCHDLKEAAENSWVDYEYREDPRGLYSSCYIDGFKDGAEWMKWKMNGDSLEGPTCKSCGFYENNCPFIRGKFMPYPSKVCKDFTFSVIKNEGEQ